MLSNEIRKRFIDFFVKKHTHVQINSSSIIPENDPTVLFTTAGMHPLVPYLMGEKHPQGSRLVNSQKCLRTDDIDEVGDDTHCTFFEMLGNWSLGDYFKEDAIKWSYELLTTPQSKGGFGFDPNRICVTCFAGDDDAPKDTEAAEIWKSLGFVDSSDASPEQMKRIYYYGKKQNWWGPAGKRGPCGPDTEIFYNRIDAPIEKHEHPDDDSGRFVEIWNNVFMQFNKNDDGQYESLKQKNVDTGMGLERMTAIMQGKSSHYDTDLMNNAKKILQEKITCHIDEEETIKLCRIILDHIRAAVFIIGDKMGVSPSNTDQGYIVRRLLRRAIRNLNRLGVNQGTLNQIAAVYIDQYGNFYTELKESKEKILYEIQKEEEKFLRTLEKGLKEMKKLFSGFLHQQKQNHSEEFIAEKAFFLFETYGFPKEMIIEEMKNEGVKFDENIFNNAFDTKFKAHQELSRATSDQKFSGGLADNTEETKKLHTATHLLHKALRMVLGEEVVQKGSNITSERLRFDFSWSRKMTENEIKKVEEIVNDQISRNLPINSQNMTVKEAKDAGAIGLFEHKYGDNVKVYSVGDFSKEICGGPHAESTGELEAFKIIKEEASSSGVRRIKAIIGSQAKNR